MSNSGHTPGPWMTAARLAAVGSPEPRGMESYLYSLSTGETITTLPRGMKAADARLIAAAPELLEALERFVTLCPSSEGLGGHAPTGALCIAADYARAAILKAKGA